VNVLFVCAGNQGRSAMAERLFDGWGDLAVSVCSDDLCPATPGLRRLNWGIQDPAGLPLEQVRPIRDEIERRVEQLARELASGYFGTGSSE
jgi:protein-tyrosine-phosphatase